MNRPFPREDLNRAAAMTGILLFLAATSLAQTKSDAEIGPADPAAVQVAVEKGLFFVEHQSMRWWKTKKCATCHEGQILLVAANIAKSQGVPVDQEKLDFWTERWVIVDALVDKGRAVSTDWVCIPRRSCCLHRDFDRDASATRAEMWTKVLRIAFQTRTTANGIVRRRTRDHDTAHGIGACGARGIQTGFSAGPSPRDHRAPPTDRRVDQVS